MTKEVQCWYCRFKNSKLLFFYSFLANAADRVCRCRQLRMSWPEREGVDLYMMFSSQEDRRPGLPSHDLHIPPISMVLSEPRDLIQENHPCRSFMESQ